MVRECTKARLHSERGVTLIELLIAVVVIGVLATMAISGFRRFVRQARSVEGEVAMMEVWKLQNGFQRELGQYAPNLTSIGYARLDQLSFYAVSMTPGAPGSGVAYDATAAPMPGWALRTWELTQYQDGDWMLTHSDDLGLAVAGTVDPPDAGSGGPGGGGDPGGKGRDRRRGRRRGKGKGNRR